MRGVAAILKKSISLHRTAGGDYLAILSYIAIIVTTS